MNLIQKTQHFGITIPAINSNNRNISEKKLHAKLAQLCEVFVFQKEKGESGYQHYQVYAKFREDTNVLNLREMGFGNSHFVPLLNTPEYMKYYCMKPTSRIGRVYKYDERDLAQ